MRNSIEWITKAAKEWVTHVIALGIVATSLLLLSRELWSPSEDNLEIAQGIASIVGPWVGVVIGFYFGVRSGDRQAEAASAQATAAEVQRDVAATSVEELEDEKDKELAAAQDRIASLQKGMRDILDSLS